MFCIQPGINLQTSSVYQKFLWNKELIDSPFLYKVQGPLGSLDFLVQPAQIALITVNSETMQVSSNFMQRRYKTKINQKKKWQWI